VWEEDEGSLGTVQTAGYDAGPLLTGQSIPSTGTVGQPLSFLASPMGVWSTLGETTWSFGDGSGESGQSVAHTYATPGDHTVTLSSVDAFSGGRGVPRVVR
jgi:PKD domain